MSATRFLALFLASLALYVLAAPIPSLNDGIPQDANMLMLSLSNNQLIAFDSAGQSLGPVRLPSIATRPKSTALDFPKKCTWLKINEVRNLPGWEAMSHRVQEKWNLGPEFHVAVNLKAFPDVNATVCVQDAPTQITFSEPPSCVAGNGTTEQRAVDVSGMYYQPKDAGANTRLAINVTTVSTIGVGSYLDVPLVFNGLSVPGVNISRLKAERFVNSQTRNTDETDFGRMIDTFGKAPSTKIETQPGSICHTNYKVNNCTQTGKGTVDYVASGWVWFYSNATVAKNQKWAIKLDWGATNIEDRTSKMEYEATIRTETRSNYKGVCEAAY